MLVPAVSSIYDWGADEWAELEGCAGVGVADYEQVGIEGVEGAGAVAEGLPFLTAAGASGDIDDVGAEMFASELETTSGASRVFVEEVDDGLSTQ